MEGAGEGDDSGVLLAAASALNESLLKPGPDTGFQEGISPSADGDLGRCPKDLRPFEKGRRKLSVRGAVVMVKTNFSTAGD